MQIKILVGIVSLAIGFGISVSINLLQVMVLVFIGYLFFNFIHCNL